MQSEVFYIFYFFPRGWPLASNLSQQLRQEGAERCSVTQARDGNIRYIPLYFFWRRIALTPRRHRLRPHHPRRPAVAAFWQLRQEGHWVVRHCPKALIRAAAEIPQTHWARWQSSVAVRRPLQLLREVLQPPMRRACSAAEQVAGAADPGVLQPHEWSRQLPADMRRTGRHARVQGNRAAGTAPRRLHMMRGAGERREGRSVLTFEALLVILILLQLRRRVRV